MSCNSKDSRKGVQVSFKHMVQENECLNKGLIKTTGGASRHAQQEAFYTKFAVEEDRTIEKKYGLLSKERAVLTKSKRP